MTSFTELAQQVHSINDWILSEMKCNPDDSAEQTANFSKHLLATKYWFARVEYINKKRFLLVLLHDVTSAWTLSLLLKSMWNCRPKDAVMSTSEIGGCLSSYDQVPMDHNRTALPVITLAQTMKNDRLWFLSLGPEPQAQVLSELLSLAGGPIMWAILTRAQTLYMRYQDDMLQNMQQSSILMHTDDTLNNAPKYQPQSATAAPTPVTPETPAESALPPTTGQKNLETNLLTWHATIKAMRESLKLEELEMTFNDGTKRTVWKVNRIRPDIMETVDFVQMLPSSVGKRILSFVPPSRLADCARVNRYWSYLVDEYRAEAAARTRINNDFERLEKIVVKNDESMYQLLAHEDLIMPLLSSENGSMGQPHTQKKLQQPSVRPSERSAGALSLRYISDKMSKTEAVQQDIRNLAELNERMERRGAADENIWKWCENIILHATAKMQRSENKPGKKNIKDKKIKKTLLKTKETAGVLKLDDIFFPSPLMKHSLDIPLKPPLYKDPAKIKPSPKPKRCISNAALHAPPGAAKRFSIWTRDVSTLYPVVKIPSYQFPFKLT